MKKRSEDRKPCGSVLWTLACVVLALPAFGEEAPEAPVPEFSLLGDVEQKITYRSSSWDRYPNSSWAFSADLQPKFSYGAVTFQADSSWNFQPVPAAAGTPPGSQSPTVTVPEAYFRITPADGLDLTVGQKRFSLGVGQTFTVGDSVNPVIGFFDQKTGFRGATIEWSPVSWASASAAYSTEEGAADKPAGAVQLSFLLDQLQLTASVAGRRDQSLNPGLGASYDLFGVIVTAEAAAEFLPQGLRPEGAAVSWTAPEAWNQPALSASGGARWTVTVFDVDVTLAGEYLHWAQGFSAAESQDWRAALASGVAGATMAGLAKQATHGIRGQENAFLRLNLASGTEYSLATFAAIDLEDKSVLGQVSAVWAPWDNFELNLTVQAAGGEAGAAWEVLNQNQDRYQASFATTYHF